MVGRAEAQHVEAGDRPRPHREHVAQDAADPGGGALVGLDEGGVVVALHLEHDREPVADVDDAGILARPLDHVRTRRRQAAQVRRDDLYEQCSFHMAETMPSSVQVGVRPPIRATKRSYSSALRPWAATISGVIGGIGTRQAKTPKGRSRRSSGSGRGLRGATRYGKAERRRCTTDCGLQVDRRTSRSAAQHRRSNRPRIWVTIPQRSGPSRYRVPRHCR